MLQCIGLVRWQTVVPYLAARYARHPSPEMLTAFEAVHRLVGMGIGEHLGYLAMGTWTVLLGLVVARHPGFPRWLGIAGIVVGVSLAVSALEPLLGAAVPGLASLNFRANAAWSVWMIALAGLNLRASGEQE